MADLPVQNIDLGLAGCSLRRTAGLEHPRRAVQQLLLPVIDLVGMNPNSLANSAIVRFPLIAASATFALETPLCFLRVRFMSCSRAIGAF